MVVITWLTVAATGTPNIRLVTVTANAAVLEPGTVIAVHVHGGRQPMQATVFATPMFLVWTMRLAAAKPSSSGPLTKRAARFRKFKATAGVVEVIVEVRT